MTLHGNVATAPDGAHGFDCNTVLTAARAKALRGAGFSFAIRYISRSAGLPKGDLSVAEAERILAAGLALMPVQHVARAGWSPNEALGSANGANAAANCRALGFPPGVCVWLDLEGVAPDALHADVIRYCNAWFREVTDAGYVPGIYVGGDAQLSGDELFFRLTTRHYWKSGSRVPEVAHRGYQMFQTIAPGDRIAGVEIDRNVTRADRLGGRVSWLARE
ncbi:MAG TPA: glycoside hydrolase domain-containing protein [Bauldia sp.]|nr:glycoside hydrolase domain-containing protein [Bauldia sp.]